MPVAMLAGGAGMSTGRGAEEPGLQVGEWYALPAKRIGLDPRRPLVPFKITKFSLGTAKIAPHYNVRLHETHRRELRDDGGPLMWEWLWKARDLEKVAQPLDDAATDVLCNTTGLTPRAIDNTHEHGDGSDDDASVAQPRAGVGRRMLETALSFDEDLATRRELTRMSAAELRRVNSSLPHELLQTPLLGAVPEGLGDDAARERDVRLAHLDADARKAREATRVGIISHLRAHEAFGQILAHHLNTIAKKMHAQLGARRSMRKDGRTLTSMVIVDTATEWVADELLLPFYLAAGFKQTSDAKLETRVGDVLRAIWNRRSSPTYTEPLIRCTYSEKLSSRRDVHIAIKNRLSQLESEEMLEGVDARALRASLRAEPHIARATIENQFSRAQEIDGVILREPELVCESSIVCSESHPFSITRATDAMGGVRLIFESTTQVQRVNADGVLRVVNPSV